MDENRAQMSNMFGGGNNDLFGNLREQFSEADHNKGVSFLSNKKVEKEKIHGS
jgi:hypothetical protein